MRPFPFLRPQPNEGADVTGSPQPAGPDGAQAGVIELAKSSFSEPAKSLRKIPGSIASHAIAVGLQSGRTRLDLAALGTVI
jgi:hypothetical protein